MREPSLGPIFHHNASHASDVGDGKLELTTGKGQKPEMTITPWDGCTCDD